MLGEDEITSIDDDLPRAKAIRTNYAVARDATLEAHEWSFAIKQFKPQLLAEPPLWQYRYAYSIPPDILRVLAVERMPDGMFNNITTGASAYSDGRRQRREVDHEVQGREILTNEEDIYCTGIRQVKEEGLFSNLFCHALAAKLAMLICYRVTESNSKFDRVTGLFGGFIQEARSRDGMQSSTRRMRNNTFARVR